MSLNLLVYNLSGDWRKGVVKTPWQPISERTGIPADMVAVYDKSGAQLDTQVLRIDPYDPARDMLIFSLNGDIEPRYGDYSNYSSIVTVDRRSPNMDSDNLGCDVENRYGITRRVTLRNHRLHVRLELTPSIKSPEGGEDEWGGWYAGSASSVVLDGKEILDRFNAELGWIGHDREKRCLQIDQLEIPLPAWGWKPYHQVNLFDKPYEMLIQSCGPICAGVTIASSPFDLNYDPRGREDRKLICRLYRSINLYKHTNHVIEELFVKGWCEDGETEPEARCLRFKARHFSHMDMGLDINTEKFTRIWDWFAIGFHSPPSQSYGFATNSHIGPVMNPHPRLSESANAHKTFSWSLEETIWAECIHLFDHCKTKEIESRTGNAWFEHIYRPLYARIG